MDKQKQNKLLKDLEKYDNMDLIHILLLRITTQEEMSDEDRSVVGLLNDILFLMNLK